MVAPGGPLTLTSTVRGFDSEMTVENSRPPQFRSSTAAAEPGPRKTERGANARGRADDDCKATKLMGSRSIQREEPSNELN